jgi:hypothetical protein
VLKHLVQADLPYFHQQVIEVMGDLELEARIAMGTGQLVGPFEVLSNLFGLEREQRSAERSQVQQPRRLQVVALPHGLQTFVRQS